MTDVFLWRTMDMIGWRRFILPGCFSIKSLFTCNPCMIFVIRCTSNFRRLPIFVHPKRRPAVSKAHREASFWGRLRLFACFAGGNCVFCEAQRAYYACLPVNCWYSYRPGVYYAMGRLFLWILPPDTSQIQLLSRAGRAFRHPGRLFVIPPGSHITDL